MDKRLLSRILSGILAGTMLFTAVSCSNSTNSDTAADDSSAVQPEVAETVEDEDVVVFPDIKYDGSDVMFLTEESTMDQYTSREIYSEAIDGSLINDTVYNRNAVIEEQFNVKIAQDRLQGATAVANKEILAGDDKYDVVMPYMNSSVSNAQQGLYIDLTTVDNLHLENKWWDRRANENLKINDKLFFTTGDISILDNDCTMVLVFNKQMVNDFGLESPYDLVRSGEWTIDKLFEESFVITADLNGDGKLASDDDRFGFYCAGNVPHSMYFGTGERIVDYDGDGNLQIVMYNERSVDVIDKVLTYCCDEKVLPDCGFQKSCNIFLEGRLFCAGWALVDVSFLRESEFDFGILPYPKFDEAQKEYSCLISSGLVPGVSIPITNKETAKAGLILEAMAYYSIDTLTVAYYDVTLTNKYFRDTESGEMLDIIFDSRVYDFGYIFDLGGLGSLISTLYGMKNNKFTSMYSKLEKKALSQLEEIEEKFKEGAEANQ